MCVFSAEVQTSSMASLNGGELFISIPVSVGGSTNTSITLGLVNNMATNCVSHMAFAVSGSTAANLRFKTNASSNYQAVLKSDVTGGSFRVIYGGVYICAT